MELSKEKRPPRSIWHNDYKIEEWYDEVFETNHKDEFEFDLSEVQ